jgi:hypothetical protein
MCDNLDVKGKERCGLEGQSLNTVVGSCEPARDSWTPTLVVESLSLVLILVQNSFQKSEIN